MTARAARSRPPTDLAIAVALPRELARYSRTQLRWRPGCEITVLRDGRQTFDAMLAAIASARTTIALETYILASDTTGERFRAALIARAHAGVRVRVLYDAVGSIALADDWLVPLRAAGVETVEWNPIAPWRRRFRLSHRDHRKVLVVDDIVAFTGGLNIADDYAAIEDGGRGWHDLHCRVRGPIVRDLARLFRRSWLRGGGAPYELPPPRDELDAPGEAYARILANTRVRERAKIRRAYLHVIKHARSSVQLQNAYFLPDRGLRRALTRAVARGVDVSVIVPAHVDVTLVGWAGVYALKLLAARGIRLLRWRGVMMHAKAAVVDRVWATIGSYNLDARSRFDNLEVNVEVLDPAVAGRLAGELDADVANCDPFELATWRALPWWRKATAWLAFRLRRLL